MIDWSKISDNVEVVELVKQIELLSEKVISLDEMALVRYQLEILNIQEELKKQTFAFTLRMKRNCKKQGSCWKSIMNLYLKCFLI